MARLTTLFFLFAFLSCLFVGCTIFVEWDPVYKGQRFHKTIVFSQNNIRVTVERMGLMNNLFSPRLILRIANDSPSHSLTFDYSKIKLIVNNDTLLPRSPDVQTNSLNPNDSTSFTLRYDHFIHDVSLEKGDTSLYVLKPTTIFALFGGFSFVNEPLDLGIVEFTHDDRPLIKVKRKLR